MGYPQPSTFDESYLFKWQYDQVSLTRDWSMINGTNSTYQSSILFTENTTFNSRYNQTLTMGYVDGFTVNLTGDDVYQSGFYLDGQWINEQIGKYQQGFIIFNLPDNATLAGLDTDGDGLDDQNELFMNVTNPYSNDTDEDGMLDGNEVTYGFNPNLYNDHAYPTAVLLAPANQSYNNTAQNLSVRLGAVSGIYNVSLYINNTFNSSQILTYLTNESDIGTLLTFGAGQYYYYYNITDYTGLSNISNIRMFTIEYTPPTNSTVILPVNNTVTNLSTINFSTNMTDLVSGLNNFSVYNDQFRTGLTGLFSKCVIK
jgi:hypothetical protein